jgi:hypothetical protein
MSNTYTEYWHKGKKDEADKKKMSLPCTLPDAMKYRGYMDGYSGRRCSVPRHASLILDKLHADGMTTIN